MKRRLIAGGVIALLLAGCGSPNPGSSSARAARLFDLPQVQFMVVVSRAAKDDAGEKTGRQSSTVSILDPLTQNTRTVSRLDHPYPFAPAWYQEGDGRLYYASSADRDCRDNDQLYVKNLETEELRQLTDGLTGISSILPIGPGKLFLTAAEGSEIHKPMCYDLIAEQTEDWSWDPDFHVTYTYREPETGAVYLCGRPDKEHKKLLAQFSRSEIQEFGVDSTVCLMTPEGEHQALYTSDGWFIDSFAVSGDRILMVQSRMGLPHNAYQTVLYDRKTGKEKVVRAHKGLDGEIVYLDAKGHYAFTNNTSELVRTDLRTGKELALYTPGSAGGLTLLTSALPLT